MIIYMVKLYHILSDMVINEFLAMFLHILSCEHFKKSVGVIYDHIYCQTSSYIITYGYTLIFDHIWIYMVIIKKKQLSYMIIYYHIGHIWLYINFWTYLNIYDRIIIKNWKILNKLFVIIKYGFMCMHWSHMFTWPKLIYDSHTTNFFRSI